ncbi:MAG: DNA gyrase inhibitor YacG [Alphaproteobacteria bacterium]|nr:DNA gyrase inhibitor YacG [Alphaproteobacteria bacterium]MBE8220915.1 DNA gyrase inhibitor YacG [Alphaproteobacteria bacterium]
MTDKTSTITGGICPICKKVEAVYAHRPFCSKACREIDLMRWLDGDYAVPAIEPPDDFDGDITDALMGDQDDKDNIQ